MEWGGASWGPKGRGWVEKVFPVMRGRAGRGWGKTKPCGAGTKTPSFGPAPPHCHPYMEPTLETINLGNNENPCLIKIGLTLNEKERKDLQELKEFQEVFAWPYEDMPRIDPEIAQHHIYTHDHIVPFK